MEILVSFRGTPITVADVGRETAVASLKEKLEELTGVPVANQKLICKGKALRDDDDTLESAGVLVRARQSSPTAVAAAPDNQNDGGDTFTQKAKLLLVGSKPSEVTAVLEAADRVTVRNDFDGVAVPKGYKRVALNHPPGPSEFSPYRFERIETLPGLPEEETAREILESLAADPGVRAVLEKHRWTVGALCELYPEGKVGISDTCVMGLNQNHGMKILLRLRTDDLKGFRKVLSIRKVLFHELAHNDVSDHNDEFYMLMRQVEREAAELDWTQQSGKTVAGRPPGPRAEPAGLPGRGGGYVLVKEAFEGGSGRLGGDSGALTHMLSARELAGQAAVQRLTPEEQEVEDCCGHTKGNKDAASAATAATPAATNTPAAEKTPSSDVAAVAAAAGSGAPDEGASSSMVGGSAEETGVEQAGKRLSAEVTVESLVSEMSVGSPDDVDAAPSTAAAEAGDGSNNGSGGIIGEQTATTAATNDAMDVADETGDEQRAAVQPAMDTSSYPSGMDEEEPSESAAAPLSPPLSSSPPPPSLPPSEPAAATASPQRSAPSPSSSPLDELLAMGFPREASMEALAASGGSIPDAAYRLLTPGLAASDGGNASGAGADTAVVPAATDGGSGEEDQMANRDRVGGEIRLPRDVRIQQAAERIGGHGDRARAVQCLEVLAAVFRNIMEHPEEAKFRKVRRSNGKFRASVGAVAGGVDLLLAAGFDERGGGEQLELGRQDPGLIWLAKSTVEAWQERLSPAGAP